jgi:hypothetical protein
VIQNLILATQGVNAKCTYFFFNFYYSELISSLALLQNIPRQIISLPNIKFDVLLKRGNKGLKKTLNNLTLADETKMKCLEQLRKSSSNSSEKPKESG